jgi:hypothetical protein
MQKVRHVLELSCWGEDAVKECLHIDDDVPVTVQLTDNEMCDMGMNESKDNESDDNEDGATIEQQITSERMISLQKN